MLPRELISGLHWFNSGSLNLLRIWHGTFISIISTSFDRFTTLVSTADIQSSYPEIPDLFGQVVRRATTHGVIEGYLLKLDELNAVEVYEAIPYAKPPIKDLRFKPPSPIEPWRNVRNCGKGQKKFCVDFRVDTRANFGSEDCLYIDIAMPRVKMETDMESNMTKFPILIWIRGVSNQRQSTQKCTIEGAVKNFVSNNILFAIVHYRMGPLGFLSAGHRHLTGNFGLDDQIEAIKWIKENAQNFNADASNIVVAGEGSGAACVSLLSASPKTKGLFNAAILRSGSGIAPWAVRSSATENNSARFIDYLRCTYNHTLGMRHTTTCLQRLSLADLHKGWIHVTGTTPTKGAQLVSLTYFTPIIDLFRIEESIIPTDPHLMIKKNARIPMMISVTDAEIQELFLDSDASTESPAAAVGWIFRSDTSQLLFSNHIMIERAIKHFYLSKSHRTVDEPNMNHLLTQITTDQIFKAPAAQEASYYAIKNLTVYAYSLQKISYALSTVLKRENNFASHGDDSIYIFNETISNDWIEIDQKMASRIVNPMVHFILNRTIGRQISAAYTSLHTVASIITDHDTEDLIDFYSNTSYFWYQTVPLIESLNLEPEYRVLFQPCTMCYYPYQVPFYVVLIVLILITICALSSLVYQRCKQPRYILGKDDLKLLKEEVVK